MFQNLLRNIPVITKNLLIINILFFLATLLFETRGIYLQRVLGMHYPDSYFFEPYQIVTHFFMHADFMHLFFNMFGLVILGSHLERVWGERKYLLFYLITAVGAAILHTFVHGIEVYQVTGSFFPISDGSIAVMGESIVSQSDNIKALELEWIGLNYSIPALGASGAIYGLITGFAMLFPNTQFMLLFPPIPIKAKWLALGLGAIALYSGFQNTPGDSIAHFAHLGGMLFGFILIRVWQKDKTTFY